MFHIIHMDIASIVKQIRDDPRDKIRKTRFYAHIYPDFRREYPRLFACACDSEFNLEFLDFMLEKKQQLDQTHDVDASDKEVYGVLNDKYINPLLSSAKTFGEHTT